MQAVVETKMNELTSKMFDDFYREVTGHKPYGWQSRLAEKVVKEGRWPDVIDIPTGCGKTSCIEIAVYALACNPEKNPRRIVYVVNRRIVVDDTSNRAEKLCKLLKNASKNDECPVLLKVKNKLCEIAGGTTPLKHFTFRGGIQINEDWKANPTQPLVISSTIDHAGSRLLFRGYGSNKKFGYVEAGLLGSDCIWLLDETHISRPFTETLRNVEKLNDNPWCKTPIKRPWHVVEMTATPAIKATRTHTLSDNEHKGKIKCIIEAAKTCDLLESNAKSSEDYEILAMDLAEQAITLKDKYAKKTIAIVVNRIKTAKITYQKIKEYCMKEQQSVAHLVIGRMRPLDRNKIWDDIKHIKVENKESKSQETCPQNNNSNNDLESMQKFLSAIKNSTNKTNKLAKTTFVVTTQCLEVGVDLDFEGMVTEISSIDSLRQRFGRLNRTGKHEESRGVIIAPQDASSNKGQDDSIYGNSIKNTWKFLKQKSKNGKIDFGIKSMDNMIKNQAIDKMIVAAPKTISLLPAHMDLLCQNHKYLYAEPDVAPFLHGIERGLPMVNVIWRVGCENRHAANLMKVIPPKSSEYMPVTLWDIRNYLTNETDFGSEGDVEWQRPIESDRNESSSIKTAFIWSDGDYTQIHNVDDIRSGDTIVLPTTQGGWTELGHIPDFEDDSLNEVSNAQVDIAEEAFLESKKSLTIRIGDDFPIKMNDKVKDVSNAIANDELPSQISYKKNELIEHLKEKYCLDIKDLVWDITKVDGYDNALLIKIRKSKQRTANSNEMQFLKEHAEFVEKRVAKYAEKLGLAPKFVEMYKQVATVHDAGKADYRFQQMLYRTMFPNPRLRAKDNGKRLTQKYYPKGFRHEFISSKLATSINTFDNDLFLHLIESHHGWCRPFVPVVNDDENITVQYTMENGNVLKAGVSTKLECVGSGAAKRFWHCIREYGWWGLAWLEAIFLLADWEVSGET